MAVLPDIPELSDRELLIETHAVVQSINTAVLLHRKILFGNGDVGLVEDVRKIADAMVRIAGQIECLEGRARDIETTLTGEGQEIGLVAEHQAARKDLDRVISLGKWIGGVTVALVSGLLWAIFTGKVSLVFH
jgi:hypothetical protein